MNRLKLTSLQNPKAKQVVKLRTRKARDASGHFLIEGFRELLHALEAKKVIDILFFCPQFFLGTNEPLLLKQVEERGGQLFECSSALFQKLSYRDRPDGLLAVAKKWQTTLDALPLSATPLFVIAEAIEKPGNLGTILRSSDAAGADGLIICDRCTDIYNPNVVRASIGTLFTVPISEATSEEALDWLKKQKITLAAATPSATIEFTDANFTQPLAIAVGTEQLGLSEKWMKRADLQVKIPMFGQADSLNVAQATTLLLYEARRQRKSPQ